MLYIHIIYLRVRRCKRLPGFGPAEQVCLIFKRRQAVDWGSGWPPLSVDNSEYFLRYCKIKHM